MNKNKISVLVPVYGVEKYIENNVRSLFNQTLKDNIEYIFVDDRTPDNSIHILQNIIEEYPLRKNQVRIIKHEQNEGLGKSRNTALECASGEYIYIIDSDDWLLQNNTLELMLKAAEESDADIVEADYCKVSAKGISKIEINRDYSSKTKLISDIICKKTPITIWNKLIKKSLYDKNCIRVPDGINNGEDYVTLPKLMFFARKVIKVNLYAYAYNQMNINSFASNRTNWKNLDSMIDANRNLRNFFQKWDSIFIKSIERMYLETMIYHLLYSQSRDELSKARQKFTECSYRYFFNIRWKYKMVLIVDALKLNSIILKIGKVFRKRGYVIK